MNKTEKLKKRLDMILAPTGISEATMEIVESQFLKACKEALPAEDIKIRLTQYIFGDITSDQFVEFIEEVFGE